MTGGRGHEVLLSIDPRDPNAGGNHRKSLVHSLEQSLRRLNTDRVDLLWLHMRDAYTPIEEAVRALDDQVRLEGALRRDLGLGVGRGAGKHARRPRLEPVRRAAGPVQRGERDPSVSSCRWRPRSASR